MMRFFRYLLRVISFCLLLVLLLFSLLYLPIVQRYAKDKAVAYAEKYYGLTVEAEGFLLEFPLRLTLNEVFVGKSSADTLLYAGQIKLSVGLEKLLWRELSVSGLRGERVRFNMKNDTTGLVLNIAVDSVYLEAEKINLREHRVEMSVLGMAGGAVSLLAGNGVKKEVESSPAKFDWAFAAGQLSFRRVNYRMSTLTLPSLAAGAGSGTIVNGEVNIGQQTVDADSATVTEGYCRMVTAKAQTPPDSKDGEKLLTLPWTVKVAAVAMNHSCFNMHDEKGESFRIALEGISARLDSVYNRGTTVRGDLKQLALHRQEGGRIEAMRGRVDLDTARVELADIYIKTSSGVIRLNAVSDGAIQEVVKQTPLRVKMDVDVGLDEVAEVYDKIPKELRTKRLQLHTDLVLGSEVLKVSALDLKIPGCFSLVADAHLSSLQRINQLDGFANFRADFLDVSCLKEVVKGKYTIPPMTSLEGEVRAKSGTIDPSLVLRQGKSVLSVAGSYSIPTKAYRGVVLLDDFYPGRFFVVDSLGAVSADIRVNGKDYRWGKASATLSAKVQQAEYKRHRYRNIELDASVERDSVDVRLTSGDPDMDFELALRGDSLRGQYVLELDSRIRRVDLKALHFSENDFTVGLRLTTGLQKGADERLSARVLAEHITIDQGEGHRNIGDVSLHLDGDRRRTDLNVLSGDFNMNFRADTLLSALSGVVKQAVAIVRQQVDNGKMNAMDMQQLLPHFALTVEGKDNNTFSRFLKSQGISFQQVSIKSGNVADDGLFFKMNTVSPVMGKWQLDTLSFGLQQDRRKLNYAVALVNPAGNLKDLYHIYANGYLEGDSIQLKLLQLNRDRKVGVDVGFNLCLQDSAISVNLFPLNPVLATRHWNINQGNWVTLYKNRKITANLQLTYENKLIRIESKGDQGDKKELLDVEIKGIDLKTVSEGAIFLPDMGGILNTGLLFYSQDEHIMAEGMIGITGFTYNSERIGDTELSLNYSVGDHFSSHLIDFELQLDKQKRALAKGHFSTSEENRDLEVKLDLPSLPLYIVNAFIPEGIMKLQGELTGSLNIGGTVNKPMMNGNIAFKNGQTEIISLGTSFGIDSGAIHIDNSEAVFKNFGLIAPNRKKLLMNGKVFFSSLTDVSTDLQLKAENFQAVDVTQNSSSMVYGKAYVDLDAALKGSVRTLSLTGQVGLLNNTVIDYVVRNSSPEVKDKSANLVRFVEFRDTTLKTLDNLTNRVTANHFDMRLFVDIGNAVAMNIHLSETGENGVAIQGGGNLTYVMDAGGRNSLLGKYVLSGGTVRYAIPVVGEKVFNIQTGSFVEWTGELMNPILDITAGELLKASVTEDNLNSRVVNFEAMILIKNNLQKPEITFDLAAPNDQSIQSQLAAFSADERAKQALNLMIYNTYSGPGTMSSSTAPNNALNSFIESELNQWSRKYLKNTGLTLGIDSYNQYGTSGQEIKRTDFSYQFSKQFFNDKINVKIGGRISTDNDPGSANSLEQNLVDDIAIEYRFDKSKNLFMKVFRYTNYESVLDGEVTQTGVGIVLRKSYPKFRDIFKFGTEKQKATK